MNTIYLKMCKVLEEVLKTLMNSDREMLRSMCGSLRRVSEKVSTLDVGLSVLVSAGSLDWV